MQGIESEQLFISQKTKKTKNFEVQYNPKIFLKIYELLANYFRYILRKNLGLIHENFSSILPYKKIFLCMCIGPIDVLIFHLMKKKGTKIQYWL